MLGQHSAQFARPVVSRFFLGISVTLSLSAFLPAHAATPTLDEMWLLVQAQQNEIKALRAELQETRGQIRMAKQAQSENIAAAQPEVATPDVDMPVTPAPVSAPTWAERTQIGGYGELHYNRTRNDDSGSDQDEVDVHRFVLFFGHQFNDWLRFDSEVEIEHAVTSEDEDDPGEVEMEQAYIEADVSSTQHLRAGLQVLPIGFLNEYHEPPTFYGVERNVVESRIIPTTWREAGIGMHGDLFPTTLEGFQYHVMLHSGLKVDPANFHISEGRQEVAEASANDPAVTAKLKYIGIPGLELGVSGNYQADVTSGDFVESISGTLFEAHLIASRGPFKVKALAAHWDLEDGPAATGPASLGADEEFGWYVEPSYKTPMLGWPGDIGFFTRYSQADRNAGDDSDSRLDRFDIGMNYWPDENVVFKIDYQNEDSDVDDDNNDGINLGVGYQF